MQTLSELLSKYDDVNNKAFSIEDVGIALCQLQAEEKEQSSYQYEYTAFSLLPMPDNNPWNGHYYGPCSTYRGEHGEPIYKPTKESITIESLSYWNNRANETGNPLLKMHYYGLVFDFQTEISGKSNDEKLYKSYVECMLTVCNVDYGRAKINNVKVLERLFELTHNNSHYLPLVKKAFADFETRHAEDKYPGFWAPRFQIMLSYTRCFDERERIAILQSHEERLLRLCTKNDNGNVDPWLAKDEAELLAEYYNKNNQKEDIKRVYHCVESAFEQASDTMMKFQYAANIEDILIKYRYYGLSDDVNRLTSKMQNLYEKSKDELQKIEVPFEIPNEVYEQAEMLFGNKASSDEVRWKNFALYFIPKRQIKEKELQTRSQRYMFLNMMGTKLLDPKGRPMSEIGTFENDPDGNLALFIAQDMNLQFYFLHIAINKLITSGALDTEKIMNNILQHSPIFEANRHNIIKTALELFLKGEYIIFSHLVVPQIENAICNIIEMSGGVVLKQQRNGRGYQLKTLDELLRDSIVEDVITKDGAYYLRLVLSDQRALNIRNLLCHGILPPEHLGFSTAGRLLHVLIMLGMIRVNKNS